MAAAFSRVSGVGQGVPIRPVYHWGGFACLTRCTDRASAYDSQCGLGFVGDFFLGHGPEQALASAASLVNDVCQGNSGLVFHALLSWAPRVPDLDHEGTGAFFGNPQATEDHAWPTVEQLSTGVLPRGKRCMDRYRRRNIFDQD